jgi:transcriptional regulator with XRE-family HTH domain
MQILGQYFRELRDGARRYPLLDRAAVEAMSDDQIGTELARRHWGMPSAARQGKRSTREAWVRHFLKKQLTQRGPTLRDIATRAKLDEAAVWKIEHDRGVRGTTVRKAIVGGLGFAADGPGVRRALALLTARSADGKVSATDLQADIDDVESGSNFNEFLTRIVPVLAGISPSLYDAVTEALSNPATVESLPALNRLAEAGQQQPRLRVMRVSK